MRRVWFVIGAVALIGCGSTPDRSGQASITLPSASAVESGVIAISSDSELARMLGTDTPSELVTSVPGLEYPAGTAAMWAMSGEPPTNDEVRQLAEVIGVSGEVVAMDDMFGPGLSVGSLESDDGQLTVQSLGEPFWNLSRPGLVLFDAGVIPCTTLPDDDPNGGQCGDDSSPTSASPATDATVTATVTRLMSVVGVPADSFRIKSSAYGSNTDVTVEFRPGRLRTDMQWSIMVSSDGEILAGSGPLRAPTIVAEVPTVDLAAALVRISRIVSGVTGRSSQPPSTTLLAGPVLSTDVPSPVATPPPPMPAPSIDVSSPVATPPPPAPPVPELPTIATVGGALATVWDASNRMVLVPAIVVTGTSGFTTTIPIVSADNVRIVDPSTINIPVRTGPPLTIPPPPPPPPSYVPVPAPPSTPPVPGQTFPPLSATTLPGSLPVTSPLVTTTTIPAAPRPITTPPPAVTTTPSTTEN